MKRSHIIALVIIAVALGALVYSLSDNTTFVSVAQAKAQPGQEVKLKGFLYKADEVVYQPALNANLTEFTLVDEHGDRCRIALKKAKPYDFERSESIVLTGHMEGQAFVASDMLLKCPSKYNEQSKMAER